MKQIFKSNPLYSGSVTVQIGKPIIYSDNKLIFNNGDNRFSLCPTDAKKLAEAILDHLTIETVVSLNE